MGPHTVGGREHRGPRGLAEQNPSHLRAECEKALLQTLFTRLPETCEPQKELPHQRGPIPHKTPPKDSCLVVVVLTRVHLIPFLGIVALQHFTREDMAA